jgi:phage repressor protein C with HTH and peptisase S24 domain
MAPTNVQLVEKLRTQMKRKGYNAKRLAEEAKVGRSFVYDILNGKSGNPTTKNLVAVAEALEVSVPYLLSNDNIAQPFDDDFVRIAPTECHGKTTAEPVYLGKKWIERELGTQAAQLRVTEISTDAMAPTLLPRDRVVIDTTQRTPENPGIFLIDDGIRQIARRLDYSDANHYTLSNDNAAYGAQVVGKETLSVLGRVVWISRKL